MKITKLPDIKDPKEIAKRKACEGCDKCPYCGNEEEFGLIKGIYPYAVKYKVKGFFNTRIYETSLYKCYKCGTEWESEPYEI